MDEVRGLGEHITNSANELWSAVGEFVPKLVGALVLLVLALLAAKLAQALVEKVLTLLRVNQLTKNKRVARSLKTAEVNVDLVAVSGRIAFWVVIVIFALSIAEVLGLAAMRDVLRELLNYLPNVLAAAIILTVTIGGARLVRDLVGASLNRMKVDFASSVASVTFYILLVFGVIMTVNQLGFDTTILTANITILVAGFTLALALAFGLGGRDVAGKIVDEAYRNHKNIGGNKKR